MPDQMSYPEPERNRLLRRIDWRFLLADPQPQKVVSFAGGSMDEALRLVGAVVVERHHCPRARRTDGSLRGPGGVSLTHRLLLALHRGTGNHLPAVRSLTGLLT